MLGGLSRWDLLGARRAGDQSEIKAYVRALGRSGIPLLFLEPGSNVLIDLRTPRMRDMDDADAQRVAKSDGDPEWESVITEGVHLATIDVSRLEKYADRAGKTYKHSPPNLATIVGNGLLVVHTDHQAGTEAFCDVYKRVSGESIAPTVLTPGTHDADGTWNGSGGAHFYFILPEGVSLPESGPDVVDVGDGEAQWSLLVKNRYVLIPPSVREEGPYRWVGTAHVAPPDLVDLARAR